MAEFTINGAGGSPTTANTIVVGANSTHANITDIKVNYNAQTNDTNSRLSADAVTVNVTLVGSLESIAECNGNVGVNPATDVSGVALWTLSLGDVFYIDGLGHPWDNGYEVISVSGTSYCTGMPWASCFALVNSGSVYTTSGTFSPVGGTIVEGEDWCEVPLGVINTTKRVSQGYSSRVYTNCWECFDGNVGLCDITVSTVTLWTDQGVTEQNVTYADGSKTLQNNNLAPGADNVSGENLPT